MGLSPIGTGPTGKGWLGEGTPDRERGAASEAKGTGPGLNTLWRGVSPVVMVGTEEGSVID